MDRSTAEALPVVPAGAAGCAGATPLKSGAGATTGSPLSRTLFGGSGVASGFAAGGAGAWFCSRSFGASLSLLLFLLGSCPRSGPSAASCPCCFVLLIRGDRRRGSHRRLRLHLRSLRRSLGRRFACCAIAVAGPSRGQGATGASRSVFEATFVPVPIDDSPFPDEGNTLEVAPIPWSAPAASVSVGPDGSEFLGACPEAHLLPLDLLRLPVRGHLHSLSPRGRIRNARSSIRTASRKHPDYPAPAPPRHRSACTRGRRQRRNPTQSGFAAARWSQPLLLRHALSSPAGGVAEDCTSLISFGLAPVSTNPRRDVDRCLLPQRGHVFTQRGLHHLGKTSHRRSGPTTIFQRRHAACLMLGHLQDHESLPRPDRRRKLARLQRKHFIFEPRKHAPLVWLSQVSHPCPRSAHPEYCFARSSNFPPAFSLATTSSALACACAICASVRVRPVPESGSRSASPAPAAPSPAYADRSRPASSFVRRPSQCARHLIALHHLRHDVVLDACLEVFIRDARLAHRLLRWASIDAMLFCLRIASS